MRADLVAATIGHGGVYRSLGFSAMWCVPMAQQDSLGAVLIGQKMRTAVEDAARAGLIPSVSFVLPRADSAEAARENLAEAVRALFPDRGGMAA